MKNTRTNRGVTGGLRGCKRSLFNGGIGVPALLKWPARVEPGTQHDVSCSTLDYFPTIVDLLRYTMPDDRPIDGASLLPLIDGLTQGRSRQIPCRFLESEAAMFGAPTLALIDGRHKLLTNLSEDAAEDMLFDIDADIAETANIIGKEPDRARGMREQLSQFIASCKRSHEGQDYPTPYTPINAFQDITGTWRDG